MAKKEPAFISRLINPVKIKNVLIFAADEQIRKTEKKIMEDMPWIKVFMLNDPAKASNFTSEEASVMVCDDMALNFVDEKTLRKNCKDIVLVLLSSLELVHCSPPSVSLKKYPHTSKADLIFAIKRKGCSPKAIMTSVVRNAEDKINIEKYSKARRFIFLVVEDEPRWISMFLPVLYNIIGQRADIKVTRTFEETLQFLFGVEKESEINEADYRSFGWGDDVVCLITDIFFPKANDLQSNAGKDLVSLVEKYYPRFPKIIASKAPEAEDLGSTAFTMPKGDPRSLQALRGYIHDHTGVGDFIINNQEGNELFRIKNIREMLKVMQEAEKDTEKAKKLRKILEIYGKRDTFSTWLYMHGFQDLGDKLLPQHAKGRRLVSKLKRHFEKEIIRVDSTPLIIQDHRIFDLKGLLHVLRSFDPAAIQQMSDNDIFSTWLERKGYPELAEEFRPIHGSGIKLEKTLAELVEKWIRIYQSRELEA